MCSKASFHKANSVDVVSLLTPFLSLHLSRNKGNEKGRGMLSYLTALRPIDIHSPWLVVHHPAFAPLANQLATASKFFEVSPSQWANFPDGTPNLRLDAAAIRGRDVMLLASLKVDELVSTLAMMYAIPRYLARSLTIVAPYLPTGAMERVDSEGEVATAKTLARLLSATPSAQAGQPTLVIYDIHALASRFFFGDNIKILLLSAVPLLIRHLKEEARLDDVVIVFPDEGAMKRFSAIFRRLMGDKLKLATCTKIRQGDRRIVKLAPGGADVAGKHVVIVDDLVQSGGTLVECAQVLRENMAATVWAYATHAVFPKKSYERFVHHPPPAARPVFDRFVTTNSVPQMAAKLLVIGRPSFVVLSLADDILDGKSFASDLPPPRL